VLRTESEARDRAQLILGTVSLVIWLIVAFGLGVVWYIDEDTPQPILVAGGIALLVAALPWLAYRRLVRRLMGTRSSRGAERRL
jgi:membrane protein YdbS with pleckstrin-like domain